MPPSMKGIYGDGGGPSSKMPMMDEEPEGDEPEMGEDEPEYSPEYMAAYDEYETAPSAETFWRAVEACVAETGKGGGGGLAILLGPKGKKK